MDASELIKELGGRLGIEPTGGDACLFEADGLAVSVNYLPELDAIALAGDIGEPPPEKLEGLYKALLAANHLFGGTAGATISLDPDSDRITLCRAIPLLGLDSERLYSEVERFVNTAEAWSKTVANYREAAAAATETPQPEDGAAAFGDGALLKV